MKNNVFKVLIVGFFIIIVGLAVIASDIIVKQGNLNVNDLTANGKVRIGSSAPTVGSYSLAFNRYSTIWGADNNEYYLGHNVYYSNGWKYRESDAGTGATLINIGGGTFNVRTVGDGAKDGAITWNQGLIVDNMGNVGIGTQTPRRNCM